jgi:putative DNA primase/helicase
VDAKAITVALRGRWQGRYGLCRCPAHADREPSLKVSDDPRKSDGVDLHCFAGCDWRDVKATLVRQRLLPEFAARPTSARNGVAPEPDGDLSKRVDLALKIWNAAGPLRGSLGFGYFTERRGLNVGMLDELGHCLRFHEGFNAVIGLMTDPATNEPTGVHRTILNADGTKREKKMLGRQGVIRLSRDEDVLEGLGISEGIETGLRILLNGWSPIWCATSAGGTARLPTLSGVESLTIFTDDDETGMKAARECAERWTAARCEARLARTKDAFT